jgi:hypothetical protein
MSKLALPKAGAKNIVGKSLTTGSPVIGVPALGQVHGFKIGEIRQPHDLVAVGITTGSPQMTWATEAMLATEAMPPARKKRMGQQSVILDGLLQELQQKWPFDNRSTADIHRKIVKRWPADRGIKTPSSDTVARHLGRRKDNSDTH